jgi:tetratricopeptide (TPR) repeat protein
MPRWLAITTMVLVGLGFLLWIASYIFRALRERAEDWRLIVRILFTIAITMLAAAIAVDSYRKGLPYRILVTALGWSMSLVLMWGEGVIEFFTGFFTSSFTGGSERVEAQPLYSIAETLRRKGRLQEAMYAIHEQLEKFPNDFRLQMLLAEIQAENANDVAGAEATILRICSQPKHLPGQIAGALNALADWHLRFDQDVDAARAALEQIMARFPNTDVAHHASNRIAHLTEAAARVVDARDPHTIVMKISDEYAPLPKRSEILPETDARVEAERLVQQLTAFPNDTEAREELAKLYVESFDRLDLATEQLELLIALPSESPRRIAHWLNLLADLQVRSTGKTDMAAATLNRVIERFPNQAFADTARQRLATLPLEVKRYEKSRVVKLGSS